MVGGNPDGSLKVTESRVPEASDLVAVVMRIWSGSWACFSMAKGARGRVRAVEARGGHVGSEEHRAHEMLAGAGAHAALVLVRCEDPETRQLVAAAGKARDSWDGPLTEFLAALDPGSAHDWVRAAVVEHSSTSR